MKKLIILGIMILQSSILYCQDYYPKPNDFSCLNDSAKILIIEKLYNLKFYKNEYKEFKLLSDSLRGELVFYKNYNKDLYKRKIYSDSLNSNLEDQNDIFKKEVDKFYNKYLKNKKNDKLYFIGGVLSASILYTIIKLIFL